MEKTNGLMTKVDDANVLPTLKLGHCIVQRILKERKNSNSDLQCLWMTKIWFKRQVRGCKRTYKDNGVKNEWISLDKKMNWKSN